MTKKVIAIDQNGLSESETKVLDMAIASKPIKELYPALGLNNVSAFYKYLDKHPEFEKQYDRARQLSCQVLEDRVLNLLNEFNGDVKKADLVFKQIQWLASVRNPAIYSQKMDINLNQNVSMRVNIEAANQRVIEMMRDVTTIAVEAKKKGKS